MRPGALISQLGNSGPSSVFEGLMKMDEKLEAAGFPPISPWWREQLRGFHESGKVRLVIRAGRRGGKSSTLCRVAVAEALYGAHKVPPGDVGTFVFVSVRESEAMDRLRTIKQILDVLKVPYDGKAREVILKHLPIQFKVYPANFRTIVGMTCIGFIADECARWRDDALGANPAKEVLASLRPAMATMLNAHEYLSSSPWAKSDAHYEHFEMGNTEQQVCAWAPTWVANPTLSVARCKELEPDEPTFRREYEAIPMDSEAAQFFDAAAVESAMANDLKVPNRAMYGEESFAGGDFAFRSDWSAIVIAHKSVDGIYRVGEIDILKPGDTGPLKPSQVVRRFSQVMKRHGVKSLMADAHYQESIREHLATAKMALRDAPKKPAEVFVRFRGLLYQGLVQLPKDDSLKSRMLEVRGKPNPSGTISILIPRKKEGGHSDDISALVLAMYQRRGQKREKPQAIVPRAGNYTRNHFQQEGWSKEELDEVRRLERSIAPPENDSPGYSRDW